MSDPIEDWQIEVIRKNYSNLNLSTEQAELIYQFQQERNTPSDTHYFSLWEEYYFEAAAFQSILNKNQFDIYQEEKTNLIEFNTSKLIEEDEHYLKQVNFYVEAIKYYEDTLIPSFFNLQQEPVLLFVGRFEENKRSFLKAEYQKHLNNSKKSISIHHFRFYRNFGPNRLKASYLSHKMDCLLPNYKVFQESMDEPTRCVANYLIDKLSRVYEEKDLFVKKVFQELDEFMAGIVKKHYGGPLKGWHTPDITSEEVKKHHRMMCLALLERKGYNG